MNDYIKECKVKSSNMCPAIESLFEEICPDSTMNGAGTDNMTAIIIKFKWYCDDNLTNLKCKITSDMNM